MLISFCPNINIFHLRTPSYNNGAYEYPVWCHVLGWVLTFLSLVSLPLLAATEVIKSNPGAPLWNKLSHAVRSKISHCPCCGTKLDSSQRAHTDKSLSCLLGEEDQCQHGEDPEII